MPETYEVLLAWTSLECIDGSINQIVRASISRDGLQYTLILPQHKLYNRFRMTHLVGVLGPFEMTD